MGASASTAPADPEKVYTAPKVNTAIAEPPDLRHNEEYFAQVLALHSNDDIVRDQTPMPAAPAQKRKKKIRFNLTEAQRSVQEMFSMRRVKKRRATTGSLSRSKSMSSLRHTSTMADLLAAEKKCLSQLSTESTYESKIGRQYREFKERNFQDRPLPPPPPVPARTSVLRAKSTPNLLTL